MRAIILAAGRGSRMKNLTDEKPKCMTQFKNKPLLDWQIDSLLQAGINEIAVVAGYKKEKIINKNITKFFENKNWDKSNMISSLFCADEWLMGSESIISYSDIFYSAKIVEELTKSTADIAITSHKKFAEIWQNRFENPLDDLESFKIDHNNFLLEIGQTPNAINEIQGQFMGLIKFTIDGWLKAKNILQNYDLVKLDFTAALQILILHNVKIQSIEVDDIWGEIDNENDLKIYEEIY